MVAAWLLSRRAQAMTPGGASDMFRSIISLSTSLLAEIGHALRLLTGTDARGARDAHVIGLCAPPWLTRFHLAGQSRQDGAATSMEAVMVSHPLKQIIEAADRAITAEDFDTLLDFYADDATLVVKPGLNAVGKEQIRRAFVAIADHFDHSLVVKQGKVVVIEGGDTALVIMESLLETTGKDGLASSTIRRGTYVFRQSADGGWLCVVDNSYGTDLLQESQII
jgi:uncharacterized protein (TIGR02246 family)